MPHPPQLLPYWRRDVFMEGGSLPLVRVTSQKLSLLNLCSLETASVDPWAPWCLAESLSQTTGDLGSAPTFPGGMLCDPRKTSDLSMLVAAGLGSPCVDIHLLRSQERWPICIRCSEILSARAYQTPSLSQSCKVLEPQFTPSPQSQQ